MNILLGVTGSVAATVAGKLVNSLKHIGDVKVVATNSALKFDQVSSAENSFWSNSIHHYTDQDEWKWKKLGDPVLHIELKDWYDVFVIAPASANTIAKMAHGICDNLLTSVWMASRNKKVLVAPAMNTQMWKHPIVEGNIQTLKMLNVKIIPPVCKTLACGEVGIGAMASIEDIVKEVKNIGG